VRHRRYGFYIMRPSAEMWFDHLLRRIRRQSGNWRFVSGVFLDELLVDLRVVGDGLPVELTTLQFQSESIALSGRLKKSYDVYDFYYNGVGASADPPECVGGMLEGFCVAPWYRSGGTRSGFAPPSIWMKQLNEALDMAGRGRELLLLARDMPLEDTAARLYALASFHLARGEATRFCYLPGRCRVVSLPEWEIALGAPLESFVRIEEAARGHENVFGRRFEHGEVFVNADRAAARTIVLETPGYLVELTANIELNAGIPTSGPGELTVRWVDTVELAPQSGAIVVRP
jgi:hypothetical protein